MNTVEEYRRHADECDALARRARSPDEREMITNMAKTWRMLADQREKRIHNKAGDAAEGDNR